MQITFSGTLDEIRAEIKIFLGTEAPPLEGVKPAKTPKAAKKPEPEAEKAPEPPPAALTPAPVIPTEKEAQDALVAVNNKHGIDKAIECLAKFGVKRGRELKEEQRAEFIAVCKAALG